MDTLRALDWREIAAFILGALGFIHELRWPGERTFVLLACVALMLPAFRTVLLGWRNGKGDS